MTWDPKENEKRTKHLSEMNRGFEQWNWEWFFLYSRPWSWLCTFLLKKKKEKKNEEEGIEEIMKWNG